MKKFVVLSLIVSLLLGLAFFISNCGTGTGGGSAVPTPWIYCGSKSDNSILVINGATNASVESIDISPWSPDHIAASPDGKRIYVSSRTPPTLTTEVVIFDTTTNTTVEVFNSPIASNCYGMAASHDGKYLYMHDMATTNLYKVYLTAGYTSEAIPITQRGFKIALNPDSTKAYICGGDFTGYIIVDLQTKSLIDKVQFPHDIKDVAVKGNYAYFTARHSDASSPDVVAVDIDTDTIAYELFSSEEYFTGIASVPNKNKLYASNGDDPGKIFIIDSSQPTIETTVITGEAGACKFPYYMAATADYVYAYDAIATHDKIAVINISLNEIEEYIYGIDSTDYQNNPVIVYK